MKVEERKWQRWDKSDDGGLLQSAQTRDSVSDGCGVAICGVAAAKVASCRVLVKKLQQHFNYWMGEDLNFLKIMEEMFPITNKEGASAVEHHNAFNPDFDWIGERNGDSLYCQCHTLYQNCAPTGDPQCPENVQIANHVGNAIFQQAQTITGK